MAHTGVLSVNMERLVSDVQHQAVGVSRDGLGVVRCCGGPGPWGVPARGKDEHEDLQVRLHGRSATRLRRKSGGMGSVRGSHAGFGRSEPPRQAGIRGCGQTQATATLRSWKMRR